MQDTVQTPIKGGGESSPKPQYHVVSFSGGKDSTAMLLGMIERGMQIDEILFCDTTIEFPAMYEHIKKVEEYINRPITVIQSDIDFEHYLLEYQRKNTKHYCDSGLAFPSALRRWCTAYLKRDVLNKYFRQYKTYNVIQYIGLAVDEQNRLNRKNNQQLNHRHPLVDWNMTEADCLKYCYDRGFDFGGLYKIFSRVSCWCCPMKTLSELRKLREHFPELWTQLQEWQLKVWNNFKKDYTVQELEIRFQLEDERTKDGLSISMRDKEFKAELNKRLGKV